MKRAKLIRYLRSHGCVPHREGAEHSLWKNPRTQATEAIPRHREIKPVLVRSICKGLSVPPPAEK